VYGPDSSIGVPTPFQRWMAPTVVAVEPKDSIERTVAEACASLTTAGDEALPGPNVVLADLGLDSLGCADLTMALEERLGVPLAGLDMASIRTVGDLAAAVHRGAAAGERIPPGLGRLQQVVVAIAGWAFRLESGLRVEGAEHVPRQGPVIIAANHRSMLDVPLLVLACPRPVVFMAKEELFRSRALGRFFRLLGGFPVRREMADVRAIDIALAVLERGDVLGIYPEGKRSKSGEMLPLLRGAAWMALRMGAPIVPAGIHGTFRPQGARRTFLKRTRVCFGPAMAVAREADPAVRREKAEAIMADVLERITRLA
jgi:1-acyl-sn-glycerol-3-phosphate acyltransferase